MILCLCPSPAIDVTYDVAAFAVGETTRVRRVTRRPGGKAVNVARVLTALGDHAVVLAPVGGATGEEFRNGLSAFGLPAETVHSGHSTRHTVTVVDAAAGQASVLTEPATIDCWDAVADRFHALLTAAEAVVISGSLPSGAPDDGLATLTLAARAAELPVVVDTSGAALAGALAGKPTVIKPNAAELAEVSGRSDVLAAARELAGFHGVAVVASLGADGLIAVDAAGSWHARPARRLRGNPTGAGDALVAALARGFARGTALGDLLGDAVALSAAAVVQPYAGEVDVAEFDRQRTGVRIEDLEAAR
ncbi:1-phosphofructokinase family hexose kinase [Amycolatopsis taiwanensis]|uniref:1-phosphofructokinase family hexose kinase n=1 Tax=Amycolatopsis taiwanensis TaxID=342230 RepID=UPI000484C90F|nr:hexose kinase [Amycolatopsis taiwanensis]